LIQIKNVEGFASPIGGRCAPYCEAHRGGVDRRAIDGGKFKAVNSRDKNFARAKVERRRANEILVASTKDRTPSSL
jgi:hypothetical protein